MAAGFLFLVLLLNLAAAASSQGDRREPVVRVGDVSPSPSPPADVQEEQQQLNRLLGSRPPCCQRKCGECAPCTPVQVRAGGGAAVGRPQCANYEPVGWKCKCGAAVFDP